MNRPGLFVVVLVLFMVGPAEAQKKFVANYDEARIPEFALPDALLFNDGTPVRTASDWPKRREEIVAMFADQVYGVAPPRPEKLSHSVLSKKEVFGGCLLYTSPSPRDRTRSRMPSSA